MIFNSRVYKIGVQNFKCTPKMASFKQTTAGKYQAIVRRKKDGAIIFKKTRTFAKKKDAEIWARNLETKIDNEGVATVNQVALSDLISKYQESFRPTQKWGRSKEFALNAFKRQRIAEKLISQLRSKDYVDYAMERRKEAQPATISNDLTHLHAVLKSASALGFDVDLNEFNKAKRVLLANNVIGQAKKRERRPTEDELNLIYNYFDNNLHSDIPLSDIVRFAIESARRLNEICTLRWSDLNVEHSTCIVRDLKHPTMKHGNDKEFKLLPRALEIINRQPRNSKFIFPYNPKTVGGYFTKACNITGIEDLRFHDLRHEAVSRLFEQGYHIQEVQLISLHTSWETLRRYTNLRPKDLKVR